MAGQCKAKAHSTGERCKRWANNGFEVCQVHGAGSKKRPGGRPVEHGRYATAFQGKLREKFAAALEDTSPLDLLPELAVQRTLLADYIGRFETITPSAKDLRIIGDLANDVVNTASKIITARNQTALTVAEVRYLQMGIINLLDEYLPNPDDRRAFVTRLLGIIPQAALTERAE